MSKSLLRAIQISRTFGQIQALQETSFELPPGCVVTLQGPNGSGKSTLLQCISGLLQPTTGHIEICGYDLYAAEVEAKRCVAYVSDVPRFYIGLSAWEHLEFVARAHAAAPDFPERAEMLMRDFGLWSVRDQMPHTYSRGMRLKLGLLTAFVRPFELLLLDEPASALDQESLELLGRSLQRLRTAGKSVLLSTHTPILSELLAPDYRWHMFNGRLVQT